MEWNNCFDYVHRSKIIRRIIQLRKEYDAMPDKEEIGKNWVHLSDKDNLFILITELESLLA